mgnify:CR=1 FL=1
MESLSQPVVEFDQELATTSKRESDAIPASLQLARIENSNADLKEFSVDNEMGPQMAHKASSVDFRQESPLKASQPVMD